MHLLLTNDDGIRAPGLKAIYEAARLRGDRITVCAPDRECSAAGQGITVHEPIRTEPFELEGARAFAIGGRPADCVRLGLASLIDSPVDMVISGINKGANHGMNCRYSGTVGAAMEGAIQGIPSIATSLSGSQSTDYRAACRLTMELADRLIRNPAPWGVVMNLNMPNLPYGEIKGIKLARLAPRIYNRAGYVRCVAPNGIVHYWIADDGFAEQPDPETDAAVTRAGYASLTPLTWDMEYRGGADYSRLLGE